MRRRTRAVTRAKMRTVNPYEPQKLMERLRALPEGAVLLERLGSEQDVHLVGGAVRDLLLDHRPPDFDLVTEGDAAAIARRLDPAAVIHDRFGTATVRLDGFSYDLARTRAESYARPGALPDVRPAALADDLRRRDFTINALAMALGGPRAGEIVAAAHALEDLGQRRLRVLHDASFIDDPTRLLRMVRYASRLGFAVEPGTAALAERAVGSGALETVSGSRIGAELKLLAREPDPVRALAALGSYGIAAALHPRLGLHDPDLLRRALALLPPDGRADLAALAAACERIGAPELSRLLDRLAFTASEREATVAAATRSRALAERLAAAASPSEIEAAARGAQPELVALAGARGAADNASRWLERLRHVGLEIDGGDLLAAGVPRGPQIGVALRAALAAKLDGKAGDRDAELAYALRALKDSG